VRRKKAPEGEQSKRDAAPFSKHKPGRVSSIGAQECCGRILDENRVKRGQGRSRRMGGQRFTGG